MLIGSADNNISLYRNPYVNEAEDPQNLPAIAAAETDDTLNPESSAAADDLNEPHDEYIPSGDQPENPAGVYKLMQDEDGQKKIVFDYSDPSENNSEQPESADGAKESGGKAESRCTTNTDKVDREIRKLKSEKKRLEQELKNNRNDENTGRDLERQLTQVESELSMKDNDTYRKQNAEYS